MKNLHARTLATLLLIIFVGVTILPIPAVAGTTVLTTTADNWTQKNLPNSSNPTLGHLGLRDLGANDAKEIFIEFQMPGAAIASATLKLECFAFGNFPPHDLEISLVPTAVNVNTLTWATMPAHGTILGVVSANDGFLDVPLDYTQIPTGQTIVLRGRLLDSGWGAVRSLESASLPPRLEVTTVDPVPCLGLHPNTVAWWPLDGYQTLEEDIVSGYDGVRYNGATNGDGLIDGAAVFDGVDDFIRVSANSLGFGGDVTVCLWYKADNLGGTARHLISKGGRTMGSTDIPSSYFIEFDATGALFAGFERFDGTNEFLPAVSVPNDNNWHFVVYLRQYPAHYLFWDGSLISSGPFTGGPGSTSGYPLQIGAVFDNGGAMNHFDGQIDEVMIFFPAIGSAGLVYSAGAQGVCKSFSDVTLQTIGSYPYIWGVSWGDYDADADADALLVGNPGALLRNDGGSFTNVNVVDLFSFDTGGVWGDYDNDGDLDMFITSSVGPAARLLRNDGGDVFVQSPDFTPVSAFSKGAAWADHNNDGYLDIAMAQSPARLFDSAMGVFSSYTSIGPSPTSSIEWVDYDNDADLDLYLCSSGGALNIANELYRNDGGGVLVLESSGAAADTSDSEASAWGDFDGDLDLDVYIVNTGSPNKLLRNDLSTFVDVTPPVLADAGFGEAAAWADYDNDGDLDLYLANDHAPNRLYRNDGGGSFTDVTVGALGVGATSRSGSVAWADYDGDGDPDLLVGGFVDDTARLIENNNDNGNHWLHVRLQGSATNAAAIGARVYINYGTSEWQMREISGGQSHGQNNLVAEFGLGSYTTVDRVEVWWPTGILDRRLNVAADQLITITETLPFTDVTVSPLDDPFVPRGVSAVDYDDDGDVDIYLPISSSPNRLFQNNSGTFVDVASGPLADGGRSSAGVWGDSDNDGDLDLYITNNLNESNRLLRNDDSLFTDVTSGPLGGNGNSNGAAWADYDDDGDLDLFVVNYGEPNVLLRNEGDNVFTDVSAGIPNSVGSEGWGVAWSDYDDDGDPDLYVSGGASSALLRNDGNDSFTEVAGPMTGITGVFGAAWGDGDADGDDDLYITRWIGGMYFRNDDGVLVDATAGVLALSETRYDAAWIDYDLNGALDLYVTGQFMNRLLDVNSNTDMTYGAIGDTLFSGGTAWGDYNGDGSIDVYIANGASNHLLYGNNPLASKWLKVKLRGSAFPGGFGSNTRGVGARVRAKRAIQWQEREIRAGGGFLSQNEMVAYFAIPWIENQMDSVEVHWPSTPFVSRLTNVAVNQTIEVAEPKMYGMFSSVADVPGDQGGNIRLTWDASDLDVAGSPIPIHFYGVYRRIEPNLMAVSLPEGEVFTAPSPSMASLAASAATPHTPTGEAPKASPPAEEPPGITPGNDERLQPSLAAPAGWDFVMLVPATLDETYTTVVPTLKDSTASGGEHYSVFFVRALTNTPGTYYDSPVDSGYSLDNIPPSVPSNMVAAYNTGSGNQLQWDPPGEPDVDYFNVYRSMDLNFDPTPADLVAATTAAQWTDPDNDGGAVYYKVTAVDFAGNESDPAAPDNATAIEPFVPTRFALHPNVPNPFNPTTSITYDVPASGGSVSLRIYDVSGALVRTLIDRSEQPGRHSVVWDGRDDRGAQASSGVYFYRLTAPGFSQTRKLILLK